MERRYAPLLRYFQIFLSALVRSTINKYTGHYYRQHNAIYQVLFGYRFCRNSVVLKRRSWWYAIGVIPYRQTSFLENARRAKEADGSLFAASGEYVDGSVHVIPSIVVFPGCASQSMDMRCRKERGLCPVFYVRRRQSKGPSVTCVSYLIAYTSLPEFLKQEQSACSVGSRTIF